MGEEVVLPVRLESLHEYFINLASLDKNSREYESGAQSREEQEELAAGRAQRGVEEHQGCYLTQGRSTEYEEDVVPSWYSRTLNRNRTKNTAFHLPDLETIGSVLLMKKRTENASMTRRKRKARTSTVITGLDNLS